MATITDQVYEYLISNGYSPEAARAQADKVGRTQTRQELTTAAIPLSVMLGGVGNLASKLGLSRFAGVGEAAPAGISASEKAIIQSKNPGRMINPETGTPMSFAGKPAMVEGAADPYVGLFQRAQELARGTQQAAGTAKDRIISAFQPQIPRNPITGAKIPTRDPVTGQMIAAEPVYSAAQRVGIPAAIGAPLVAAGYFGGQGEGAQAPAVSPEDLYDMRREAITPADLFDMRQQAITPEDIHGQLTPVPMPPPRPANLDRAPAPTRSAPEQSASVQQAAARPEEMTLRDLWKAANASGEARDFVRADQAMQSAIKRGEDIGYYGQSEGKKAGGSVNGKDAAVHKALEIIHHMITNR